MAVVLKLPLSSHVFISLLFASLGTASGFNSFSTRHCGADESYLRRAGVATTRLPLVSQQKKSGSWDEFDRRALRLSKSESNDHAAGSGLRLQKMIRSVLGFPLRLKRRLRRGDKCTEDSQVPDSSEAVIDSFLNEAAIRTLPYDSKTSASADAVSTDSVAGFSANREPWNGTNLSGPQKVSETPMHNGKPHMQENRSINSASNVDLSGEWNIIVSDAFKEEYDKYLTLLGQPLLVRSVALSIVSMTTESTEQNDEGMMLSIRGRNVRGTWERTLMTPEITRIVTADGEDVEAEAWWENSGTVHRSWLRGVSKYGGGDFESKRYLESNGKVLVCESTFHPRDATRENARVTWRFLRQGVAL
jgi:hypothetical protein